MKFIWKNTINKIKKNYIFILIYLQFNWIIEIKLNYKLNTLKIWIYLNQSYVNKKKLKINKYYC